MKVRNGFVSNSSSCSFVAIGVEGTKISDEEKIRIMKENNFDLNEYKIYDDDKEPQEWNIQEAWYEFINEKTKDDDNIRIYSGSEDGVPEGTEFYGKELVCGDYGMLDDEQYSLNDIEEIGNKIKALLNISGDVKLLAGTRMT